MIPTYIRYPTYPMFHISSSQSPLKFDTLRHAAASQVGQSRPALHVGTGDQCISHGGRADGDDMDDLRQIQICWITFSSYISDLS